MTMHSSAVISDCGRYRYLLSRNWSPKPPCTFVMLNPSTADGKKDDPTIRKCIAYAKFWGCGALHVVNLFAYRATNPSALTETSASPIGPSADSYLTHACQLASMNGGTIVCAWGNHGGIMNRGTRVRGLLDRTFDLHVLGLTKKGEPVHPLYQKGTLKPLRWDDLAP